MDFTMLCGNFKLELCPKVYREDMTHPINTEMAVMVESNGFKGSTAMDIDIKDLTKFAADLCRIYQDLSGEAKIEEPYGVHMFLSFEGDGRGGIAVCGYLRGADCSGNENSLTFHDRIDQTALNPFCFALQNACSEYMKHSAPKRR